MRDALGAVQSVLVLGGGSDIARATIRRLADEDASRLRTVVLAARDASTKLAHVPGELPGIDVHLVEFDADDVDSHPAFFDDVMARHEDIDVVLVAFALLHGEPLDVLHTNVIGTASVLLLAAERLEAQGHGDIVWLGSVAGQRVQPWNVPYGAGKAGIDGFCQGLADKLRLAGTGVHLMVVRPGFVRTKMTTGMRAQPLATTADAVAAEIVRGLRRRAEVVWAPRPLRAVFAAVKVLPAPVWRRMARR
jgi:decaprenylphospho-beta-D-erythro-pentofuranosid-2-ulose 2-reductase